jgi:riboflavin synthase
MFTGLVQAIGRIASVEDDGDARRLRIDAPVFAAQGLSPGESIAVSGVCLTVVTIAETGFEAEVSVETLRCTTLGTLKLLDPVNLERCLTLGDLIGGHLVSGHVDGIGELRKWRPEQGSAIARFAIPAQLSRYVAVKGSICVDGVSLTVNAIADDEFEVNFIPHTLAHTVADGYAPGSKVNIEVDLIARYLERLLSASKFPSM